MPTARSRRLTGNGCGGTLRVAHGRDCSRAFRRPEGCASRRYFAPMIWESAAANRAARIADHLTGNTPRSPGIRRQGKGGAKAAIDRSQNGSNGSSKMALILAAADTDESERMLEVKATGLGKFFPFYVTANEVRCSDDIPDQYHLFRVFNMGREPQIYILHGSLKILCQLEPVLFRVVMG